MPHDPEPPVEFLLSCSDRSLDEFELAALNAAANKRRVLRATFDQIVEDEARALFARWIKTHRSEIRALRDTGSLQKTLDFPLRPLIEPTSILGPKKSSDTNSGNQPGKLAKG